MTKTNQPCHHNPILVVVDGFDIYEKTVVKCSICKEILTDKNQQL